MTTIDQLTTRIIRDIGSLQALIPDWTRLWEVCEGMTSFQRPQWSIAWVEAFRPYDIRVVEVRRKGELLALAPMFCYERQGQQILAPVGAGITDYLDWLVRADAGREAVLAIMTALEDSSPPWSVLDLPDLQDSSPLLAHTDFMPFQRGSEQVCPALYLCPGVDNLNAAIPQRQRKNLRTARNRTARTGGARVEVANEQTLPEFVDALLRLHATRWHSLGLPGVLSEQSVQRFHEVSAPELLRARILRLYGLRFDGELIAVLYTLSERDAVYFYLQGFDPNYAFLSPGIQIIAAAIEDAIRERKRLVDFLRGSEAYKYSWGARDRVSSSLRLSREDLLEHLCAREAA
jgi:CelD/BcsL family acetyltransferase involved in cellulose biosynthesis